MNTDNIELLLEKLIDVNSEISDNLSDIKNLRVKSFNRLKQPFSLYVLPVAGVFLELSHKSRCA